MPDKTPKLAKMRLEARSMRPDFNTLKALCRLTVELIECMLQNGVCTPNQVDQLSGMKDVFCLLCL
jgi:hypothetical protein